MTTTYKKSAVYGLIFVCSVFHFSQAASRKTDPLKARSRFEAVPSKDILVLAFPGKKGAIPYEKFGKFEGVGTKSYRYVISDKNGLAEAAGQGIFPNSSNFKDPKFKELKQSGVLEGNHWNFVDPPYAARNFYKWASTQEDPGVKQFYIAVQLERAGLIEEAIKAYYAVVVHFPKTTSWTYYKTPWYIGPSSIDRIIQLLRHHPEIKLELQGADIKMDGKFDKDTKNDEFYVNPGKLINIKKTTPEKALNLAKLKIIKTIGTGKSKLVQYENRQWQFLVDNKPFLIKALAYSATPLGKSPDRGNWVVHQGWQEVDTNNNGKHDGFEESFIDKNGNTKQDKDEPTVGDFSLLKDLGVNSLRVYHHVYNKTLLRRLQKDYGIYSLVGDYLGVYAIGSGASWTEGTDYNNPQHQAAMLASIRQMVLENKDEEYVLMWVLGNENVYGVANNSGTDPKAFYTFVNKVAQLIKELDPTRPVAISNGDLFYLNYFKEYCPDVDIFGANIYRGEQGFGWNVFNDVKQALDKPVFITEYGVSAIAEGFSQQEAEAYQAMYLANNWEDLEANMAGRGVGNALGGSLFEFMDEWWKANSDLPEYVQKERAAWYATKSAQYKNLQPNVQESVPQFGLPFLDGWSYEEWLGIIGQGDGSSAPFARVLRPAYFRLKELWNK
ncbi:MAG: glycoside hydrolase family 2 TIM barrel-domain containing protein [Elusimicrobiota bacterium]